MAVSGSVAGFLSTLSLRRATAAQQRAYYESHISIHALLAESDTRATAPKQMYRDFYPRSPCGERQAVCRCFWRGTEISIHALLAESDSTRMVVKFSVQYFYPRSPCGERLITVRVFCVINAFLSTLSLRRATCYKKEAEAYIAFLSTLSLRRAT